VESSEENQESEETPVSEVDPESVEVQGSDGVSGGEPVSEDNSTSPEGGGLDASEDSLIASFLEDDTASPTEDNQVSPEDETVPPKEEESVDVAVEGAREVPKKNSTEKVTSATAPEPSSSVGDLDLKDLGIDIDMGDAVPVQKKADKPPEKTAEKPPEKVQTKPPDKKPATDVKPPTDVKTAVKEPVKAVPDKSPPAESKKESAAGVADIDLNDILNSLD
jgi:hypothetical protein